MADIGAGSGYFTLRLARAVEPNGTVFAVDVDEGMLNYLRQRLAKEDLKNITVRQVPPDDPLLISHASPIFSSSNEPVFSKRSAFIIRKTPVASHRRFTNYPPWTGGISEMRSPDFST